MPQEKASTIQYGYRIENMKLVHECFPKHFSMGTTRMNYDKESDEECNKRGMSIEISKVGMK